MHEVLREDHDQIRFLTLNRPQKLNSLTVSLFKELLSEIESIEQSAGAVRCVVLKGAGRCFSAGHDLSDIDAGEEAPYPHFQGRVIERLANLPVPVVSA